MTLSRCQALTQVADAVQHVAHAVFLVADLALDAQRTAIADLLQRLYEGANVHLSLPERHLLAPGAGDGRPARILDVDAADVRAEHLYRTQRISLVVEQHV